MSNDLYRIVDWDKNFENHRSRARKVLNWVPLPNKHDGDGYTELVDHPNGAAHFGAWVVLVQIASKAEPRGTLVRSGDIPHTCASLRRMSKLSEEVFEEVIPRLVAIGWLEVIETEELEDSSLPSGGNLAASGADLALSGARVTPEVEGKGINTSSCEDNPPPPASPCLTEPSPAPTPVPAPPSPKPRNCPRKADLPAEPGKDTSPPPPATQGQRRRSWLDDFDEVWMGKYGGHMIFGQAGKVLKPLRELHGHEKTLAAWRVYIGKTEAEYASPNRFCSTFGTYLPAEPPPRPKMPVEWGNSPAGVR